MYLSGIVQQLEPEFPDIHNIQSAPVIVKVMQNCLRLRGTEIKRKQALSIHDIIFIANRFQTSASHNDLLFSALLITGFHSLSRLGELTFPDNPSLRDWKKVTLVVRDNKFEYLLPAHKADKFFEGNRVLVRSFNPSSFDPCPFLLLYLLSRDRLFLAASPFWLTASGEVPTRSFFLSYFHVFFPKSFGGASMRAGGATYLAKLGTPSQIICAIGRWSSNAWEVYIHMHPTLLRALLHRA